MWQLDNNFTNSCTFSVPRLCRKLNSKVRLAKCNNFYFIYLSYLFILFLFTFFFFFFFFAYNAFCL